jgi:DNA-binding NtrC family response regulator
MTSMADLETGVFPGASRRVLVVEDHDDTRTTYKQLIELALGIQVDLASDGAQALELLPHRPYSVVITDLRMPRVGGMKLLEEIQAKRMPVTVIVTTGHGSIEEAVQAIRMGAYDFLTKPPDPERFCHLIDRALRERTLLDEVALLRSQVQERFTFQNLLSKNPRMFELFELIGDVAQTTTTVLVEGETGTGKEEVARAIHRTSSSHRSGPFVAINCAALPETLLESELFGHEKGSFTGASTQRTGRFERAHGGTLFLDEVGDIPLAMQVKLLRVLQERRFERIGGHQSIEVDVRVIAATNRSLSRLVREGKFREDLFYRLNVVKIDLPPLRERPEDIPLLAAHFAQKHARLPHPMVQIAPDVMEILLGFSWPGNVRQLENAIERACVTARDAMIRAANLPPEIQGGGPQRVPSAIDLSRPLPEQLEELHASFEERYLRKALKKCRGHVGRCAKLSGLSRRSVTAKIGQYNIDTSEYRAI